MKKIKNQMEINEYTPAQLTMLELLAYPNPEGIHSTEDKWRNLCRQLKLRLDEEKRVSAMHLAHYEDYRSECQKWHDWYNKRFIIGNNL